MIFFRGTLRIVRSPPKLGLALSSGDALPVELSIRLSSAAAMTSKDMPGCCSYPGLPGYNTHEHRNLKCSKDLRCMVTQFDDGTPCDLGDAEDLELDAEIC